MPKKYFKVATQLLNNKIEDIKENEGEFGGFFKRNLPLPAMKFCLKIMLNLSNKHIYQMVAKIYLLKVFFFFSNDTTALKVVGNT